MFKIRLANTSNELTEQDLKTLARKTDGYSEGDVSKIVSDVLKQRVRMLQTATHFKVRNLYTSCCLSIESDIICLYTESSWTVTT